MLTRSSALTVMLLCAAAASGAETAAPSEKPSAFVVRVTGTGRPMVLIPGLACSGDVWASAVEHYSGKYECHVLTLAGFAGQPAIRPPFLETVRRDLAAYIRAKKLQKPVVVGHSLGGFLAFWLAATEPDLVGPVISVDGVPYLGALRNAAATPDAMKVQATAMRDAMATQTKEQSAASGRLFLASMITDPKNLDIAAAWGAASDPATKGQAVYEMLTTDLRQPVAAIKTPVLLVGAGPLAKDPEARKATEAAYEGQVAKIPSHRVVIDWDSRHFIMMDDPKFLYATMDAFLGAATAPPAP